MFYRTCTGLSEQRGVSVNLVRANSSRVRGPRRASDIVRGATHIQVVSSATRDQADPLAPAWRRFGNFV